MPVAVYLLGLAVFAQATSEFMLSGLLPAIAADLDVSLPAAGGLTSAFALGMIVGAPLMALASLRRPPRATLLMFLSGFLLCHVVGALTSSYPVLLGTRVLAALANAGFLSVALAVAVGLVPTSARARATATLLAGTTIACVAGVPGGAALGQLWGWRSAFWAVALACVPALVAVVRFVPRVAGSTGAEAAGAPSPIRRLRALAGPRLALLLCLGAIVNAGTFGSYTYLAPLVTDTAGLDPGWVPVALAAFGVGSFVGVTVAGRMADARPTAFLLVAATALLVGWAALAAGAGVPGIVLPLMLVQGGLAFAVGSTLIAGVLAVADEAPGLGAGLATSAFNVGAALGPWFGGLVIGAGLGYRAPVWFSAGLMALAFGIVGVARLGHHRTTRAGRR